MESPRRLQKVIDHLKLNPNSFAKAIGLDRAQSVYDVLNEKAKISGKFAAKIISAFPQFDLNWLLTGEGTMLNNIILEPEAEYKTNQVELLNEGQFKILTTRVVSQYAYAGYLKGFNDIHYLETLPVQQWFVEREYKGNYVTFQMRGDSMDDGTSEGYKDGELLLAREIGQDKWADSKLHIKKWDFVIVCNDGILAKRIIAHDVAKGIITVHSLNDIYPDMQIELKNVKQIFNIVQSLRKR